MTRFSGSYTSRARPTEDHETLRGIFSAQSVSPSDIISLSAHRSSLFVEKGEAASLTVANGRLQAAVVGTLSWKSRHLFSQLPSSGNGAELLLHAYLQFGTDLFSQISGTFAFAIIDESRDTVIVSTDHFGTTPVYYSSRPTSQFAFATSTTLFDPSIARQRIDLQALFNYFYFHVVPSPLSIYSDILKLGPAQFLVYRNSSISLHNYWEPNFSETLQLPVGELRNATVDTIRAAVHRSFPTSGAGCFLSGGLDSSSIAGLAQECSSTPLPCYSMGFAQAGYDELSYARTAARHFQLNLREFTVQPDHILEALPTVAKHYSEPFGNSSAIPTFLCARAAANDGVQLLLAGDGGDELFAGNTRYVKQQLFEAFYTIPNPLRAFLSGPAIRILTPGSVFPPVRKLLRYVEQAAIPLPDRLETYNFLHTYAANHLFTPEFLRQVDVSYPVSALRERFALARAESSLNKMLFLDWKFTLADNDLRKVSEMCQLAGVRVSYPMLDASVVSLSTRIPSNLKIRHFRLRSFYKNAFKDFLPGPILSKQKHGFGLPFGEWLKSSPALQTTVYGLLADFKTRDILLPDFIDQLLARHQTEHSAYFGTLVWLLAFLEQWLQEHRLSI